MLGVNKSSCLYYEDYYFPEILHCVDYLETQRLTSLDSRCTSCLRQAVAARLSARCGLPSSRTRRGTRAPGYSVAVCESGNFLKELSHQMD
jgi:hypothetical protein